jgi:hypothetical protein
MPSIEDARKVQADFGFQEFHVAFVGDDYFVMAHTDEERQDLDDLHDCLIHQWMSNEAIIGEPGCCFPQSGWHLITDINDATPLAF